MNLSQYKTVKSKVSDGIFGQRITFTYINDFRASIRKEYKDLGIFKISVINAHVSKKSYYEMANTSTGLQNLGVEMYALRDSHYNYEKLNGFLACLKSDENKKYMIIRFDNDPERKNIHIIKVVYVDKDGKTVSEKDVEAMMTASALKKKRNEYGRSAKLDLSVGYRPFKWTDIARLSVAGLKLEDDRLTPFLKSLE
jgi:hypothetical protein